MATLLAWCLNYSLILYLLLPKGISITANLTIITYDPLYLNLTFNQKIPLPKFQLLFNQIPIPYSVSSQQNYGSFIINGALQAANIDPKKYINQKYAVMFTEPLDITGGSIDLDSFVVRAYRVNDKAEYSIQPISQKPSHFKYQNQTQWLAILALVFCVISYFLAYTTLIGLSAYNFLALYVYISLQSSLFTSFDYRMALYFLFDVHQLKSNSTYQLLYMMAPIALISVSFIISIISRIALKKMSQRSNICNYIYYYLSYKVFIITWQIMCMPLFANVTHIIRQYSQKNYLSSKSISIVYIYVAVVLQILYCYMCYFTTNPQIYESESKWLSYTKTSHFQLFQGFHLGNQPNSKLKRNYKFIYSVWRLALLILITASRNSISNSILQFAMLAYLYLVRPFRYNFFNYFTIIMQSLISVFFLYRHTVILYINISEQLATSTQINNFLLSNIVIQSFIIALFLALGVYEFYHRVRVFKINIRKWKRDNVYALGEVFSHNNMSRRKTTRGSFMDNNAQKYIDLNDKSKNDTLQNQLIFKHQNDQMRQFEQGKLSPIKKIVPSLQVTPQKQTNQLERSRKIKRMESENSSNSNKKQKNSPKLKKQKLSLLQSISLDLIQNQR